MFAAVKRLTRDQAIVLACIGAITVLAWLYLINMAREMAAMAGMPGMDMAGMVLTAHARWGVEDWLLAGSMWNVMMAGMMLPSAVPMILLLAAVERRQGSLPVFTTPAFVLGYLLIWSGFALAALGMHGLLLRLGLLDPELKLTSLLGGAVFIAAGLYEWLPLKQRCLAVCQSPFGFIAGHWRPGIGGALHMGLSHGAYCLGCCWALMSLLFVGGVMNLIWVAALTMLVLLQKVWPGVRFVSRTTGLAMLAAGLYLVVSAEL